MKAALLLLVSTILTASHVSVLEWDMQAATQDPQAEPTVFRKLALGGEFPDLELLSLDGKGLVFGPDEGRPSLIALLRPDQENSRRCLSFLANLALDKTAPDCELVVVGMVGRRGPAWEELSKALPNKVALHLDAGTVQETLGVIVLPSIALLDSKGQSLSSFVLFDEESGKRIRAKLEIFVNGSTAELDPAELAIQRFAHLDQSATALESAGEWQSALTIRRSQLELGVQQAQARLQLGRTLYLIGEFEEAALQLRQSITVETSVNARVFLGRTLAKLGELDEAKTMFLEVLPLAPQKARIHRELADIYKKKGNLDQTLEHLKSAIEELKSPPPGEIDVQE
ncbi:MAG: hypothetical protein HQ519_01715 [Planctomycetes bacterium]|nr:hypothetical protein [Planctomycetota bacterium]